MEKNILNKYYNSNDSEKKKKKIKIIVSNIKFILQPLH